MLIPVSNLIDLEDLSEEIRIQYRSRRISISHVKTLMQVESKDLPPIKVLRSDKGDVVIDGRHRAERARRKKQTEIEAEFINFTSIDDLIMQGYSANQKHGMPDKVSRRVDYAEWLIVNKQMTVREAAETAGIDPSAITKRHQKVKQQQTEEKPVESERLKPLIRFFKALEGLKNYTGTDDDFFDDLREVLQSSSSAVEDIQENLVSLVESYSLSVNRK